MQPVATSLPKHVHEYIVQDFSHDIVEIIALLIADLVQGGAERTHRHACT
jgi:hypothetical protein